LQCLSRKLSLLFYFIFNLAREEEEEEEEEEEGVNVRGGSDPCISTVNRS
jgi:hypothetical protein